MQLEIKLYMLGLYISWESFSLMHYSFSCIITTMPAILCFFIIATIQWLTFVTSIITQHYYNYLYT